VILANSYIKIHDKIGEEKMRMENIWFAHINVMIGDQV